MNANELRELILEYFEYDPHSGVFTWVRDHGRIKAGSPAGCVSSHGDGRKTWRLRLNGKNYNAHRIAFLIMEGWLPEMVDHRDLDPINNAWDNLRAATSGQNARNRPMHKNNKLGVKGVIRHANGRYRVRIKSDGKNINLGWYDDLDVAAAAYARGAEKYHGEFARAA
jgi:hypothetical protein